MRGVDRPEFSYQWVQEQVMKKGYKIGGQNELIAGSTLCNRPRKVCNV